MHPSGLLRSDSSNFLPTFRDNKSVRIYASVNNIPSIHDSNPKLILTSKKGSSVDLYAKQRADSLRVSSLA